MHFKKIQHSIVLWEFKVEERRLEISFQAHQASEDDNKEVIVEWGHWYRKRKNYNKNIFTPRAILRFNLYKIIWYSFYYYFLVFLNLKFVNVFHIGALDRKIRKWEYFNDAQFSPTGLNPLEVLYPFSLSKVETWFFFVLVDGFSKLVQHYYCQFQKHYFVSPCRMGKWEAEYQSGQSGLKLQVDLAFEQIYPKVSKTDMRGSFRWRRRCTDHTTAHVYSTRETSSGLVS